MNATSRWTPRTLRTASIAALLLASGLAAAGQVPAGCTALFAAQAASDADSADGQYQRIEGFSGLRSDRLLAALGPTARTPAQRRLWLQQLAARDAEASAVERGNSRADAAKGPDPQPLDDCRAYQVAYLMNDTEAFDRVVAAARVPDDYRNGARILGLYSLFKPFYRRGIDAWQAEAATASAPQDGARWLTYQPLDETAAPLLLPLNQDALGLPQPDPRQRAALFARHAPILRLEQLSRADRLGSPLYDAAARRGFDTLAPQLYQHLGWSKLGERWHLQLVYQFWFSQRPKPHALDLLGGELDGLIWRVTLDDQGAALLYDAIHPCGCWHALFLPATSPLQVAAAPAEQERRLTHRLDLDGRSAATLWLSGGAHRLQWVDGRGSNYPAIGYRRVALDQLRQLPHPQGRRSLYQPDGLVAGSERLERWLLWPSGVRSPGAMRQWGRHATAFIGRSQFDDPQLLNTYLRQP
ncbi:MAG: hypothetical protein V4812_05265 [Pseudomonadota bacterium]